MNKQSPEFLEVRAKVNEILKSTIRKDIPLNDLFTDEWGVLSCLNQLTTLVVSYRKEAHPGSGGSE